MYYAYNFLLQALNLTIRTCISFIAEVACLIYLSLHLQLLVDFSQNTSKLNQSKQTYIPSK